ncbi:MAG: M20/M25/M40 family metallo-hydrolase [Gemmatimonadetes bacterium]|nr:M20/M25/M40 family metallo-hydrolase [Gemmatimonadota bacterium]
MLALTRTAGAHRRLRGAALAATIGLAITPGWASAQIRSPERFQRLAREMYEELIEINTSHSVGNTTTAAEAMRARLLAAGFLPEDVVVMGPREDRGNLVARLRGRSTGLKPILLLSHLDVVEADPADWTLPPFELIERDGTFYGRGTSDDKDETALHVATLIRLKEEGYVPERDIIVAATAGEEGGGFNGVRWLLENHRELIDAAFALNEGGGGLLDEQGKRIANTVQASEKKSQNFQVEVTNPGGHSSRPRPDNAISELAQALTGIAAHQFPVRLNEVTREYLRRSVDIEAPEIGAAMRALLANERDERAIAVLARDPRLNSILRTTCVATMLEGGHATNALPQRARATVNCRMLPDEDPAFVLRSLQQAAAKAPTARVTTGNSARNTPPSALVPEVLAPVERITEQLWPGVPVVPVMSTGATDGASLRTAGIPTYGISGLFYGETFSHGMNERIPVNSFYEGQEFLYRLAKAMTSGAQP